MAEVEEFIKEAPYECSDFAVEWEDENAIYLKAYPNTPWYEKIGWAGYSTGAIQLIDYGDGAGTIEIGQEE